MQVLPGQSGGREDHDSNLQQLCPDGDATFAETIREKASGHREQNEWHGEERAGDQNEPVTIGLLQSCAEDDEDYEIFISVVVECALELGYNQRPKTPPPRWRLGRFLRALGGGGDGPFQRTDRSIFAHKTVR